jgi:chromosome transmission fidelity protein 1
MEEASELELKLESEGRIVPPVEYGFPLAPYNIQTDFMQALFTALEYKKLGIFESPTGTVKTFIIFIN